MEALRGHLFSPDAVDCARKKRAEVLGEQSRRRVDAFKENTGTVGGCTLGLYARAAGAPLRLTKDVDWISTVSPWVLQETLLVLVPRPIDRRKLPATWKRKVA